MEAMLNMFSEYVLGGYGIEDANMWTPMHSEFWDNFRNLNRSHPIYTAKTAEERGRTIPFAIHGDEGRGLAKVPLMVISFQVLIPSAGPENLSNSQYLGAQTHFDQMFPCSLLSISE